MRRKPWVYVCGPFRRPSPSRNTAIAMRIGKQVRDDLGVVVCIPHLSLFEDIQEACSDDYWLDATMDQMRCCDAVYRYSNDFSEGADAEVLEAERLNIPVFRTLPALAEWVNQWKAEHAHVSP